MALQANVNDTLRIIEEVTPGTAPVTGYQELKSSKLRPMTEAEFQKTRGQGSRFTNIAILSKEWAASALSGQLDYNEIHLFLDGSYGLAVKTTPVGATLARQRVWTPGPASAAALATFAAQIINAAYKEQVTYGSMDAFAIKTDTSKAELSGNLLWRKIIDTINGAVTTYPLGTAVDQVPISSSYFTIKNAATWAGLPGASALGGGNLPFGFELARSGLVEAAFGLDGTGTFAETVEKNDAQTIFKLNMAKGAVAVGLRANMRAGTKTFFRVAAPGPLVEAGQNYLLQIDVCGVITAKSGEAANQSANAMDWTFDVTPDATSGKAIEVTLISAVA